MNKANVQSLFFIWKNKDNFRYLRYSIFSSFKQTIINILSVSCLQVLTLSDSKYNTNIVNILKYLVFYYTTYSKLFYTYNNYILLLKAIKFIHRAGSYPLSYTDFIHFIIMLESIPLISEFFKKFTRYVVQSIKNYIRKLYGTCEINIELMVNVYKTSLYLYDISYILLTLLVIISTVIFFNLLHFKLDISELLI